MTDFSVEAVLHNPRIRHCELHGEYWFSVIDFLAELRSTDYPTAQNFYHVLKNRMHKNGVVIPGVKPIRAQALDGKLYLTDFVGISGLLVLVDYIRPNLQRESYRFAVRQDDERKNFHPQVIAFFERQGWQVDHHPRLAFGSQIDILAVLRDGFLIKGIFIVECKPQLPRQKFYAAVGQILCYRAEYGADAVPVIATHSSQINEYFQSCCHELGIRLLAVDMLEHTTIVQQQRNYDLVTEKPLLPRRTNQ